MVAGLLLAATGGDSAAGPVVEAARPSDAPATEPAAVTVASVGAPASGQGVGRPADRVLVRWADHVDATERETLLARLVPELEVGHLAVTADVDALPVGARDAERVAARLRSEAAVDLAEVDRTLYLAQSAPDAQEHEPPDDPLFGQQWALENVGQQLTGSSTLTTATAGVDVRLLGAWDRTRGDPAVVVAVIDTAVNDQVPDLAGAVVGQVATAPDYLTGSRIHGTAVSSVIAARADDGTGIAGVAPAVSIYAIAAFSSPGEGPGNSTLSDVLLAFELAEEIGADVINASWVTDQRSALLESAVRDAGVPVVAASGNEGAVLLPGTAVFPAGFALPNLVTVTAIGPRGGIPGFANIGANVVDLAAPGADVVVTAPGGARFVAGTSFAAPHVSGAIALARSAAPYATTSELVDAVSWTSRVEPSLVGRTRTGGMLDVEALVRGVDQPVCRRDQLVASSFTDVSRDNAHVAGIDCIVARGLTAGVGDSTYAPDAQVTRAQMASFLSALIDRAVELPAAPPAGFVDVAADNVHAAAIDRLAALGIVQGSGDGRFRPEDPVTRGQLATFLVGTYAELTGDTAGPSRRWFVDTTTSAHADSIDRARDLGLVRGMDRVTFAPGAVTRRDQMASLLARGLDALGRGGVDVG